MGEFFKPWRRKIGCVTLLLACAFTAAWVRCAFAPQMIQFSIKSLDSDFIILSYRGILFGKTRDIKTGGITTGVSGVRVGEISFWYVIVPLTILSAFLLLRKPRPAKPNGPNADANQTAGEN